MDERFAASVAQLRYCTLRDKEESELLEQVLLSRYEAAAGFLPRHNYIHA